MSRPSIYHPSITSSSSSTMHNSTLNTISPLQSRIQSKRQELQNLQQLRDLSQQLANQMQTLEQKLATLRDGTEAVACVLGNWESVLGVIGLVGARAASLIPVRDGNDGHGGEPEEEETQKKDPNAELPETLVRIPVQNGDATADTDGGGENSIHVKDESRVRG